MAVSALGSLADLLDPPDTVFEDLDYEPACRPREEAATALGFERARAAVSAGFGDRLPPPCGGCPQELFHTATQFDVLYGGAAGGGKTKALLMEGIRSAKMHPGLRIGAFRRTYDELAESFFKELASIDFARAVGARWNGGERELKFPNSSVIRFRYLETIQDATRRQGGEYQLVLLDERTLIPPDAVSILVEERIRTSRTDIPVIGVRSGTNPGGPGHGAVKDRYIKPTDKGKRIYTDEFGRTVRFIQAKVSDNPHIERADPGYIRRLDAIPDKARRKAMRDGNWDSFSGQFFEEWSSERTIVDRFLLPASWARYVGIDYGFAAPWAVLWAAKDPDGRLWLYRGLYERKVGEKQQARKILEAERGGRAQDVNAAGEILEVAEPAGLRHADPSMWNKTGDALPIASQYALEGCGLQPANNDRLSGWQRVRTYLTEGPACAHHRALGEDTCPMLHVLDGTCPDLVRTLPDLPYSTKAGKTEDLDTDAEDHAADALRYLVMAIGVGPDFYFPEEPAGRALDGSELLTDMGGGIAMRPVDPAAPKPAAAAPEWEGDAPRGATARSPWAG